MNLKCFLTDHLHIIFLFSIIESKLIKYDFTVRRIISNPDGYPRPVIVLHHTNSSWNIDRPFPCPSIEANLGDQLEILVRNELNDQSTSIHFHGLHMLDNPWADGTEDVTQCPIEPHQTFLYQFNVTQSGTFWYHSHHAQQYADGLVGPLIIHDDPIERNYSYNRSNDYTMIFQEWYHETWSDLMAAYQGPFNSYQGFIPIYPWPPTSFLLNGHGKFNCRTRNCQTNETWRDQCGDEWPIQCIPLRDSFLGQCQPNLHQADEFYCPQGQQIRLRIINAASGIPLRIYIDQHNLTIVARDSLPIHPITVTHLHVPIGQRIDVIVQCSANDPTTIYKIYFSSRNSLQPPHLITGPTPTMWIEAHLIYSQSKMLKYSSENIIEQFKDTNPDDPFFEYKYLRPQQYRRSSAAKQRIILSYDVHWNNRPSIDALEEWGINNITYAKPKQPILQGIYLKEKLNDILAESSIGRVNNIHETHLYHIEYQQTYEILLINEDVQQHPWHIHGYTVDFIAAGKLPNLPPIICNNNRTKRTKEQQRKFYIQALNDILPSLDSQPEVITVGDSFNSPRQSYVLFRFTANNGGPWFFHCHMDWHISPGLALVFSVEQNKTYQSIIQSPPKQFPICYSKTFSLDLLSNRSSYRYLNIWIGFRFIILLSINLL